MLEPFDQLTGVFALWSEWFVAQPLPIQIISCAVGLAVLWVLSILLRVILVALRAAFRGL